MNIKIKFIFESKRDNLFDKYIVYSYRIERVMGSNTPKNITLNNENLIFEGIICAVNIHRQAMKLVSL